MKIDKQINIHERYYRHYYYYLYHRHYGMNVFLLEHVKFTIVSVKLID